MSQYLPGHFYVNAAAMLCCSLSRIRFPFINSLSRLSTAASFTRTFPTYQTNVMSPAIVQLKSPIRVKRPPIHDHISAIPLQVDCEVKVLRPSSCFVQKELVIHRQPFEDKRNSTLQVVIFAVLTRSNVLETLAPFWCKLDADFAKLLLSTKRRSVPGTFRLGRKWDPNSLT